MTNTRSKVFQLPNKDYDWAVEVLRNRMEPRSGLTQHDIERAVQIVREFDPDHRLLRYRERGRI